MPIDSASKRKAAATVGALPHAPGVTPITPATVLWRASSGWSYVPGFVDTPIETRVTQAGSVPIQGQGATRVTQAGSVSFLTASGSRVTQAGSVPLLGRGTTRVTQAGSVPLLGRGTTRVTQAAAVILWRAAVPPAPGSICPLPDPGATGSGNGCAASANPAATGSGSGCAVTNLGT